jgi:hypothetical protein
LPTCARNRVMPMTTSRGSLGRALERANID